jgi:sigma-B regulation protein RsbU (phosphoserine phosphatase)
VVVQDSHRDVRVNNTVRDRFGITSFLVVPLVTKNNLVGSLCFNHVGRAVGYREDEVDFARKLATSVTLALENAGLYQTQRGISEALQESLVAAPRRIEGVEFGYMYRSATQAAKVGGDLYDIFELEGGKVCGLVGDVSGKGVQAATLASLIRTTIKAYAYQDASPASTMARTNEALIKVAPGPVFATVFLCVIDVRTGQIAYCSAGHPPALLRHADGRCEFLEFQSPVIGAFSEKTYREGTGMLDPGDILLLYSDGVTEARRNGEMFREERLARLVSGSTVRSARRLPGVVFDSLVRFTGGTLLDDVALLAIALTRPPGPGGGASVRGAPLP